MTQDNLSETKRSIIRNEDRVYLGRLMTKLQNDPVGARSILLEEKFDSKDFRGHVIGVTGVAGVGKSTFIKGVIEALRKDELTVVVIAIDPTSRKNGWAILGDRIRMRDRLLDEDQGVFIRGLASRGAKSGLTASLRHIIKAARAFADIVIVETAGSGQVDIEIHQYVDTLVLLLAPLGDMITVEKAGQQEYAHFVVVNCRKGFDGNDRFFAEARAVLSHEKLEDGWQRKVYKVDAKANQRVENFVREGLYAHREFLALRRGLGSS